MFDNPYNIQLTYNSRLKRARLEFLAEECFKNRKPPKQLLTRVEDRLKDERADGFIETYKVFGKRFEDLWNFIRSHEGEIDPKREIRFTIAQGSRVYTEIKIDASQGPENVTMSCQIAPKKMATIPFNAFLFNVMLKLEQQGVSLAVDRAQMRFLHQMLKKGHTLNKIHLLAQPLQEECPREGYLVRLHPKLRYATLHVFNGEWLNSRESCGQLLRRARDTLNEMNTKRIKLNFLSEHSAEKIVSLASKMQGFGFQMPYDLLIAFDESFSEARTRTAHAGDNEDNLSHLITRKLRDGSKILRGDHFHVEVSELGMRASVAGVEDSLPKLKDTIDTVWFQTELAKMGIVYGFEEYLTPLVERVKTDLSIMRAVVAKGLPAKPGENVELHFMTDEEKLGADATIDMRARQNHKIAHEHDLIAEVRYTDGEPGVTVEGANFMARGSAVAAQFHCGEGVGLLEDYQFYALRDGLIVWADNTLSCQTTYVHNGSINLASGDLKFEGSVVVEGDIEAGASVEVNGPLVVRGSISSARVRVMGDLEVKGGVITGKRGSLWVQGNANIGFIENSVIQVKQSLLVQRSIAHSWIIAGGVIAVADESRGSIVGGLLCAWQAIVCAKLGMDQGHTTQCRVGGSYQDEIRLQRLIQRTKRCQDVIDEGAKGLEILSKRANKNTADYQLTHEHMTKRQKRLNKILNAIKDLKTKTEHGLVYNADATIVIRDILDKNCTIQISGKKIAIPNSMKAILLSPHAPKGMLDLGEVEGFARHHPEAIVK